MRRLKDHKRRYTLQVICKLSVKGPKQHMMRSLSKIKQGCRTVFIKQLSLVNLAVMSIIRLWIICWKVMVRTMA